MAVDGTLWRTPDTPENDAAFGRTANVNKRSEWPQLRMVCQMEVTSHLLSAVAFDIACYLTKMLKQSSFSCVVV